MTDTDYRNNGLHGLRVKVNSPAVFCSDGLAAEDDAR